MIDCDWARSAAKIADARFIALEAPIVAEWRRRWQELEEQRAEARFRRDLGAGDLEEGARIKVRVPLQQGKSWWELLPWAASVLTSAEPLNDISRDSPFQRQRLRAWTDRHVGRH